MESEKAKKYRDRIVRFSASAKADYKLMLINRAIMLLVVPALVSKIAVTTFLYFWLIENYSALSDNQIIRYKQLTLYTIDNLDTITLFISDSSNIGVLSLTPNSNLLISFTLTVSTSPAGDGQYQCNPSSSIR